VAVVTAHALPHSGGIETHVDEVARRSAAAGVPTRVLTADASPDASTYESREGFTVRRFRSWPRYGDFCFSPGLAAAVRRCGADIVHIQGVHTLVAPLALLAARRAGIPTIVTFHTGGHSSAWRRALRPAQWRTLAPLLRRAAALVAVSEFEVELFSRALRVAPSRVRLIRNGADPLPVGSAPTAEPSGHPLIVSVGRLERYKGHHRLVLAMPAVLAEAPEARLVLAGQGPYEPELLDLARALGVEHAVEVTSFGPDRRADLGRLVARADVVALLSDYEAHPVAVMEALALGRPVVVAATSGLVELARDGLVSAVPPDAPAVVVARELLRTAEAPPHQVPPGILRSWDDCASEVIALYREVAACEC
jgi:glycosyltransferase involved in cell wall biosynthesis